MRDGWVVVALCAVAFLSGCAALVFETLWFRVAGLAFGNGLWASSIVLASFMAGLAAGNALAGSFAWRLARPIRFYAGLELWIGVTGALLVWLVPSLTEILAQLFGAVSDTPWLLNTLRFPLSFLLMMVPATAMGATLPVLVKAAFGEQQSFGRVLGLLYGWNTFGAVGGALLGEVILIDALGVRVSALVAMGLDMVAAGGALLIARELEPSRAPRPAPTARPPLAAASLRLLGAAFLAGTIFLAMEVVWFRFLALRVVGTSLVFAVLLAVVLVGISAGGLLASRWLRASGRAGPLLPALALATGCAALACYALFDPTARAVLPGGGALHGGTVFRPWTVALLATPLMLPVAVLSGVLFTSLGDAAREGLVEAARTTGLITLANTLGGAVGSLLAGFVLLPWLGVEASLIALSSLYGVVALLVWIPALGVRGGSPLAAAAASAAALALLVVFFPHGLLERHLPGEGIEGETSRIVAVREGRIQTLVYVESERFGQPLAHRLYTDGFSMSGNRTGGRRYMKAFVYLPAAMHPDLKRALLISYGVGSTAKALTDTRSLESIDVVDISSEILDMSRIIFPDPAEHPLNDPRVRVHVEDGRFFLQATDQRYDLITGEPPPPKYASVVNLYTREYFELLRSRLTPGGMATYWLPVHTLDADDSKAIIRAFCDAFPDCSLWNGSGLDWILLGTRDAQGPVSAAQFRRQWSDPAVLPELTTLGFEAPEQLLATFMAGPERLNELTRDTPPLVDDFPHRLSPELLPIAETSQQPLYRLLLGTRRSARDFETSAGIDHLVPPALRVATLPWFEWQMLVNTRFGGSRNQTTLANVYDALTRTELRTLPLWLLGTSVEEQALARAVAAPEADGDLQLALGMGALAGREYAEAARRYGELYAAQNDPRVALLQVFALCLAGDLDGASAVAQRVVREHPATRGPDADWRWLEITFGLPDPRRS